MSNKNEVYLQVSKKAFLNIAQLLQEEEAGGKKLTLTENLKVIEAAKKMIALAELESNEQSFIPIPTNNPTIKEIEPGVYVPVEIESKKHGNKNNNK